MGEHSVRISKFSLSQEDFQKPDKLKWEVRSTTSTNSPNSVHHHLIIIFTRNTQSQNYYYNQYLHWLSVSVRIRAITVQLILIPALNGRLWNRTKLGSTDAEVTQNTGRYTCKYELRSDKISVDPYTSISIKLIWFIIQCHKATRTIYDLQATP